VVHNVPACRSILGLRAPSFRLLWIRLFATQAANIKIEKTDRQTEKLSTEITEQKTEIKTATNAT